VRCAVAVQQAMAERETGVPADNAKGTESLSTLRCNGKMHVFGGSWGSTLALAYAIAHPATVQTLILRGVFLCRRADVDYFFQGNAAEFAANPLAMPAPGAYLDFPTAWRHFVDVIPPEDRGDVVKGLAKAFSAPPRTDAERERLVKAASACVAWEAGASRLNRDENSHGHPNQKYALTAARILVHYMINGGFLGAGRPRMSVLFTVGPRVRIPFPPAASRGEPWGRAQADHRP
jgi:proline iminopeptidase